MRWTNRRGIGRPPRRYRQATVRASLKAKLPKTEMVFSEPDNKIKVSSLAKSESYKKNGAIYQNPNLPYRDKKSYFVSEFFNFVDKNRRLLFYYTLFLFGVILGVVVFSVSKDVLKNNLTLILHAEPLSEGISGGFSALISSAFLTLVLLLILFISGLSACGAPIAVIIPIFFGLGIGLSAAFHYNSGLGGIAINAVLIIPHTIVSSVAIVLGSIEAVKMSSMLSGYLISYKSSHSGLGKEFKVYYLRFLLFIAIAIAAGVVDVIFRAVFSSLIS